MRVEVDGGHLDHPLRQRTGRDGDALGDRERQRQPLVVVGVLADQVDAARGERGDVGGHRDPGHAGAELPGSIRIANIRSASIRA